VDELAAAREQEAAAAAEARGQADGLQEQLSASQEEVVSARAEAETAVQRAAHTQAEMSDKAARLARLEGG